MRDLAYRSQSRQGGFTLIELIIASSLITIVMLGAYTTFHSVIRNWRSAEDTHVLVYGDSQAAKMWIERDLRSIPSTMIHGGTEAQRYFVGTSRGFECITYSIPMNVELEPYRQLLKVEYRLRKSRNDSGHELIRSEAPVEGPFPMGSLMAIANHENLKLGRKREFVLARNVSSFSVEYMWPPYVPDNKNQFPSDLMPILVSRVTENLPKGFSFNLEFFDAKATPERQYTSFPFTVVIPGEASPVPMELLAAQMRRVSR